MLVSIQLLLLITAANGAPLLLKKLLASRFDQALDFQRLFFDGRPIFGRAKTFRGIAAAFLLTPILAALLELPWVIGFYIALGAMLGDLISSFIKRRMGLAASARMTGLDQIPESLLPLLLCREPLALSWLHITVLELVFFIAAIILSKLLYHWHLRDQPY